jgi:hypothetical protein
MMEAIHSSETSVLTRATRRHIVVIAVKTSNFISPCFRNGRRNVIVVIGARPTTGNISGVCYDLDELRACSVRELVCLLRQEFGYLLQEPSTLLRNRIGYLLQEPSTLLRKRIGYLLQEPSTLLRNRIG